MIGHRSNAVVMASVLVLSLTSCLLPPGDSAVMVVQSGPPPERVEYYRDAPGPDYYWISGYWAWNSVEYMWVPGRWARPPRGYRTYQPGYWQRTGHGWRWHEGKWKR